MYVIVIHYNGGDACVAREVGRDRKEREMKREKTRQRDKTDRHAARQGRAARVPDQNI
jgi:hypothetical protein